MPGKGIQIVVGTDYSDRDLKRAQRDLDRLKASAAASQGPMRKLGATMRGAVGPAFALAGAAIAGFIVKLGVEAVQAAIEEEKSVARLRTALDNLAMGFAMPVVEDFIDRTQRASGIADDQLRPALAQLAQATGNLYDAQKLLNVAMDVSAGTGRDLGSVTTALARAAQGQTTSLRRLAPSIDAAVLKTGDLTKITGELTRLFGGQAQARAATFAGTMDRLSIAGQEAMEALGQGFLDAFTDSLGGMDDFMGTIRELEPELETIGTTIGRLAGTIAKMSDAIQFAGTYVANFIAINLGPFQKFLEFVGVAAEESDAFSAAGRRMSDELSGTVSSGIQQATDDMGKMSREAEELQAYFEGLNEELKIFGELTGQRDAVRGYQDALDNLRKSVKENGKTFKDTTNAGRDNADALDRIFESAQKVAEGQQTAAEKLRTMEQASRDANAVLATLGVPPEQRAKLLEPFDALIAKFRDNTTEVDNLKSAMESIPTDIVIKIRTETVGGKPPGVSAEEWYGAKGGTVPRYMAVGGATRGIDTVPAMLAPGEFVVRRQAVRQFGASLFSQLNRGINPLAGMSTSSGSSGGLTINGGITVQSAPGEAAETSLPRALRRMAFLAGI
jgi:uncharacterized protein YukE